MTNPERSESRSERIRRIRRNGQSTSQRYRERLRSLDYIPPIDIVALIYASSLGAPDAMMARAKSEVRMRAMNKVDLKELVRDVERMEY